MIPPIEIGSKSGYLGLYFPNKTSLSIGSVASAYFNYTPANAFVAAKGVLQAFTVTSSKSGSQPQTYRLTATGIDTSKIMCTNGAEFLSFNSDGTLTLTIPAGTDSATLGLIYDGDAAQAQTVSLTSQLLNPDDTPVDASSNTLNITFAPGMPGASQDPSRTIQGDLQAINFGTADQPAYRRDDLGNLIVGTTAIPDQDDILNGSSGNDLLDAGTGNNRINAQQGGNDTLRAGNGNDSIQAGDGNNLITGGGGHDIIDAGNGNNRVYVNSVTDIASAINAATAGTGTGQKGALIGVGIGDNTIVGGAGNDYIVAGSGHNLVILGSGNDTFSGGENLSVNFSTNAQWSTTNIANNVYGLVANMLMNSFSTTSTGDYQPTGTYDGNILNSQIVGGGDDTIFAGSGNSLIFLSNGNNYVDAGTGNTTVWGGDRSDTIFGGSGKGYLAGGGGDDYIDGESGSRLISGGLGNNTIYGGTGNDTIYAGWLSLDWATHATGDNYVESGDGNTVVYGSGGNDTLFGGSGKTTIYGGAGNEYIEGGDGESQLYSGSTQGGGSDTIFAGDGNTTIIGGAGNDFLYGGNGIDLIRGGSGTTVIDAGDGGTVGEATQIIVGSGDTTVYGGAGIDDIHGGSGKNVLYAGDGGTEQRRTQITAGSGNTTIYGGNGIDSLVGGSGDNLIYAGDGGSYQAATIVRAGSGNSTLVGGAGVDRLLGGSGQTTFMITGGGDITIAENKPSDIIRFADGLNPADLTLSAQLYDDGSSSLVIDDGDGGTVTVMGGLTNGAQFQFGDGTVLSLSQLMQQAGVDVESFTGSGARLQMSADDGATLTADSENETIYGLGAGDTLVGGTGNAVLVGGGGDATYDVNAGSGYTMIGNSQTSDVLAFGAGIDAGNLYAQAVTTADGSTTVTIDTGSAGAVAIAGGASGLLSQVALADGSTTTVTDLLAQSSGAVGITTATDGSYRAISNDGHGNAFITQFDASGIKRGDTWRKADGSHGSDTFNSNGSSSGTAINADGSHADYTDDGHGNTRHDRYDARNMKQPANDARWMQAA